MSSSIAKLNLTVNFAWIPGHAGIPSNKAVDALAKAAIEDGDLLEILLPSSEFFPTARDECWKKSNRSLLFDSSYKSHSYFNSYFISSKNLGFTTIDDWIEKQLLHSIECAPIIKILLLASFAEKCQFPACVYGFESEDELYLSPPKSFLLTISKAL